MIINSEDVLQIFEPCTYLAMDGTIIFFITF
jgi:hypothetical protein